MPGKPPNRWIIAAAAIFIQLCCGALYSWSVFVKPLAAMEPWSLVQISATFEICLGALGVGAMVGGVWQDRVGPRLVVTVAGVLYGVGFLVSAISVEHQSLAGLYIGYGVLSGLAIGMAYICPVAVIVKWFPDKRGKAIGATVMGYGAGALVMGPLAARLIIHLGVAATFEVFGAVYFLVIAVAGQFQGNPPLHWKPAGWVPRAAASKMASRIDYTVRQAIRTWRFWLLWLLLVLNTSAGIMIISQASPLTQQQVGISAVAAAAVVAAISIFNAFGRVAWAWISDLIGCTRVFFLLFAIQACIFFALPRIHALLLFEAAVCAIAMCYGGGWSVLPILATDVFGPRYMGGIYGWMTMVTWLVAAIPSPLLVAHVRQTTGTYQPAILTIGCVMLLALPLPWLAGRAARRVAQQQTISEEALEQA
ncbi:MAG TPA: OFA family MFS transporter [Bryobacteraceae bacterium]|nr:OFA family MFS transporter [Bryobacteraceae bacterium]